MTPGFIQPLTTALLIEKLKYTIAKVRPDQRIWREVVMRCLGIGSIPRASSSCCCLAHWPGSRSARGLGYASCGQWITGNLNGGGCIGSEAANGFEGVGRQHLSDRMS